MKKTMKSTFALVIPGNAFTFEGNTYYKVNCQCADMVAKPGSFARRKSFDGKTLVFVI